MAVGGKHVAASGWHRLLFFVRIARAERASHISGLVYICWLLLRWYEAGLLRVGAANRPSLLVVQV